MLERMDVRLDLAVEKPSDAVEDQLFLLEVGRRAHAKLLCAIDFDLPRRHGGHGGIWIAGVPPAPCGRDGRVPVCSPWLRGDSKYRHCAGRTAWSQSPGKSRRGAGAPAPAAISRISRSATSMST